MLYGKTGLTYMRMCTGSPSKISYSRVQFFCFFYKFIYFIILFIYCFWLRWVSVAASLLFSTCSERRPPLVAVHGPLTAVASPVVEHGLQAHGLQQLWHVGPVVVARGRQSTGSVVVAHGPSCSAACGILLGQGSNPCPLHWQADS